MLGELLKLADQVVSPAMLVFLALIYSRMAAATSAIERLEKLIDRTIDTVNHHSEAIAKLEGWLERHGGD